MSKIMVLHTQHDVVLMGETIEEGRHWVVRCPVLIAVLNEGGKAGIAFAPFAAFSDTPFNQVVTLPFDSVWACYEPLSEIIDGWRSYTSGICTPGLPPGKVRNDGRLIAKLKLN